MIESLRMLTQEEVAELFHAHVNSISFLRELGILPATKIGKNYMFSQSTIAEFQVEYKGKDVSNRVKAIHAMQDVVSRCEK